VLTDDKLLQQILGGFADQTPVIADDGYEDFEVTIHMGLIHDALDHIIREDIPFETLVKNTQDLLNLVFNNALAPFHQRVKFVLYWSMVAIDIRSEMHNELDYNRDILHALGKNKAFMHQHRLGGFDISIVIVDHWSTARWSKSMDTCGGGRAFTHEYAKAQQLPFAVVALDCLLKGHADVVVHEVGHLVGAEHDLETEIDDYSKRGLSVEHIPISEALAYKVCGRTPADSRRTIMSYPCKGFHVKRLPHFSCKHYNVFGLPIGYAATSDKHGSSNCDIISKNIRAVSRFAKTHPQLAARQLMTNR
jgi:Metallo-peptidase family M12B Reprolysin-like